MVDTVCLLERTNQGFSAWRECGSIRTCCGSNRHGRVRIWKWQDVWKQMSSTACPCFCFF